MILLAFLDSPSVFFVLATIGIVDCTFRCLPVAVLRPVPFPFSVHGMAILLPSGRDGTDGNITVFFWLLLYIPTCTCTSYWFSKVYTLSVV